MDFHNKGDYRMWEYIGNISSIIGIITAVPVIGAAVTYICKEPRRKKRIRKMITNPSSMNHAAISITIGTGLPDIKNQVEQYIVHSKLRDKIFISADGKKKHIYSIKEGNLPGHGTCDSNDYSADAEEFIHNILGKICSIETTLNDDGIRTIHLFYAGPAMALAPIAAQLTNRFSVVCYHYDNNGAYYQIGLLQEPK